MCNEYLTPHPVPIVVCYTLRPAGFEIQGWPKIRILRMPPDWPWTLSCQKYPVYIAYLTQGPCFTPFALWVLLFKIISVLIFPQWWTLNFQKKKKKKNLNNRKLKISKIQDNIFVYCVDHWEDNPGDIWNNLKSTGRVIGVLKFRSNRVPC